MQSALKSLDFVGEKKNLEEASTHCDVLAKLLCSSCKTEFNRKHKIGRKNSLQST